MSDKAKYHLPTSLCIWDSFDSTILRGSLGENKFKKGIYYQPYQRFLSIFSYKFHRRESVGTWLFFDVSEILLNALNYSVCTPSLLAHSSNFLFLQITLSNQSILDPPTINGSCGANYRVGSITALFLEYWASISVRTLLQWPLYVQYVDHMKRGKTKIKSYDLVSIRWLLKVRMSSQIESAFWSGMFLHQSKQTKSSKFNR